MRIPISILLLFNSVFCFSQVKTAVPSIAIHKTTDKITIDGELTETAWTLAERIDGFKQMFPSDTSFAKTQTLVRVCYDDNYLYVSAICYDELNGKNIVQSLKRDFSYPVNDAFAVYIDCLNDQTNGFSFGVNPLGVQREGLISNGGGQGVTTIWDNKWTSEVKIGAGSWVVEMAIPFKSLRFKSGVATWRINFSRNDLKRNENSVWSPIPRNFNVASLAFTGNMKFDEAMKKTSSNISIIPYITGGVARDYITQNKAQYTYNGGLDAKVALTSSINLDLTINPDFSQVEVDRQVTNLSRFSIFFPERRSFFIENSDLFERFGFRQIRPFFSRNIGLYKGQIVPIIGGFRISGNINKNWRIGVMSMQTEHNRNLGLESQNYSVAAISRNLFKRSNISFIFVNQQTVTTKGISDNQFNRIAGADYNLQSANNKWLGKLFYHYSFTPQNLANASANASFLSYSTPKFSWEWNHEYVEKNYLASVGFVPRIFFYDPQTGLTTRETYLRFEPSIRYKFYPKSKIINNHYPELYVSHYLDATNRSTEYLYQLSYNVSFQNSSTFAVKYRKNFIKLRIPVDVTFKGNTPILANDYYFDNVLATFTSSSIKSLFGNATFDYGNFYNGTKLTYSGELSYRKQPWGVFSVSFSQDEIKLPAPYTKAYITLIGPKVELSFTKSIFFTTFAQYNTQQNNINLNCRLQWRFKPMSDLYIVYTDNYYSIDLAKKNKALVIKLIYWISV
jgi:hypothetical protein